MSLSLVRVCVCSPSSNVAVESRGVTEHDIHLCHQCNVPEGHTHDGVSCWIPAHMDVHHLSCYHLDLHDCTHMIVFVYHGLRNNPHFTGSKHFLARIRKPPLLCPPAPPVKKVTVRSTSFTKVTVKPGVSQSKSRCKDSLCVDRPSALGS